MKKRILAFVLALALACPLLAAQVPAAQTLDESSDIIQAVRVMGILTGDASGNLNLAANVTRAQFAKMLVAASSYRDSAGSGTGSSLFSDVKSGYWASAYIRVAVENNWMVGYVNGSFKPERSITLEEACTSLLRMLGYDTAALAGSFPTAQLSKADAVGLLEHVDASQGTVLTRSDCACLFYDLMTSQTSDGKTYASTVGFSLTAAGELDYTALVTAQMKGPFVLESGTLSGVLPFGSSNVTVYRNGRSSTLSAASAYDVYYYNTGLRTVWVYDSKITGAYTAASPSTAAPTSVTVGGGTYTIGTSAAAYKLSSMGGFAIGDTVTLLLGMDGTVVDAVSTTLSSSVYYGIVTDSGNSSYTDADGKLVTSYYAKVACTDGTERQFTAGSKLTVGVLASCSGGTAKQLSSRTLGGKVNSAATKLGDYTLADSVQILDTSTSGDYGAVRASRLAGLNLTSSMVRYYVTNSGGEITHLILQDVTDDIYTYGLLTSVSEQNGDTSVSGSYRYLINGAEGSYTSGNTLFNVSTGGAVFKYSGGSLSSIKNLSRVSLSSVSNLTAAQGNTQYEVASSVQVYVYSHGTYSLAALSTLSDSSAYTLTGYRDASAAGGLIRVIVAVQKTS